MPTAETGAREHQRRWVELIDDPALQDLPYKIETNSRGQIVLSPPKASHSDLQGNVLSLLVKRAPDGLVRAEFPVATSEGVKVPDVIWVDGNRRETMRDTGDPPTLAPNICIEVMSESNTDAEMQEKRRLYLEAGAEEVWIVSADGEVRFFGRDRMESSGLVSDFPSRVEA